MDDFRAIEILIVSEESGYIVKYVILGVVMTYVVMVTH